MSYGAQEGVLLLGRRVVQTDPVYAVPFIGGVGEPLVLEDMTQVTFAVVADNLYPSSVLVRHLSNGSWDTFIERRPSTARVKLCLCEVQGFLTSNTCENTLLWALCTLCPLQYVLQLASRVFRKSRGLSGCLSKYSELTRIKNRHPTFIGCREFLFGRHEPSRRSCHYRIEVKLKG